MIQNKLVRFKTYSAFQAEKNRGNIDDSSIVFIKDRKVIYQGGVEYAVSNIVDITNIDSLNKISDCGTYIVCSGDHIVGSMTIISDTMNHLVTQIFTSHYVFNTTDGNWNTDSEFVLQDDQHNDNKLSRFYRSYRLSTSGTATWSVNTWSNWKPDNDFYLAVIADSLTSTTTSLNNLQANSLVSLSADEEEYDPTKTKTTIDDVLVKLDNLNAQVATAVEKANTAISAVDKYSNAALATANTASDKLS